MNACSHTHANYYVVCIEQKWNDCENVYSDRISGMLLLITIHMRTERKHWVELMGGVRWPRWQSFVEHTQSQARNNSIHFGAKELFDMKIACSIFFYALCKGRYSRIQI